MLKWWGNSTRHPLTLLNFTQLSVTLKPSSMLKSTWKWVKFPMKTLNTQDRKFWQQKQEEEHRSARERIRGKQFNISYNILGTKTMDMYNINMCWVQVKKKKTCVSYFKRAHVTFCPVGIKKAAAQCVIPLVRVVLYKRSNTNKVVESFTYWYSKTWLRLRC